MASKTTSQRITAAGRRSRAVQLRIEGLTFAEIGKELRISGPRAYQLVREALSLLTEHTVERADRLRTLEAMRLDELHAAFWDKAIAGDYRAADRVIRIMERRAKLFGLDAPTKYAPTSPDGEDPYESLSEKEVHRRIAEKLAKYGICLEDRVPDNTGAGKDKGQGRH